MKPQVRNLLNECSNYEIQFGNKNGSRDRGIDFFGNKFEIRPLVEKLISMEISADIKSGIRIMN